MKIGMILCILYALYNPVKASESCEIQNILRSLSDEPKWIRKKVECSMSKNEHDILASVNKYLPRINEISKGFRENCGGCDSPSMKSKLACTKRAIEELVDCNKYRELENMKKSYLCRVRRMVKSVKSMCPSEMDQAEYNILEKIVFMHDNAEKEIYDIECSLTSCIEEANENLKDRVKALECAWEDYYSHMKK